MYVYLSMYVRAYVRTYVCMVVCIHIDKHIYMCTCRYMAEQGAWGAPLFARLLQCWTRPRSPP